MVGRVGYRGMAYDPCGRVPSTARLLNPEEANALVGMRRGVPRRHSQVAPKAALQPRAQVVHYLHPLQADWVVDVCPVRLTLDPAIPGWRAVRRIPGVPAHVRTPARRDCHQTKFRVDAWV